MISTMRIDSITSRPDRAGRYTVRFADGTVLRLYPQTVEDFGLYTGKELNDGEWKNLQTSAGQMSAKMRAVRIVAASSVSKKDLEHRLIQKGEKPQQAKAAVAWMSDLSLIDDEKTAEQIVNRCISKGYGLNRAKQALYEKRIPKEYWEKALSDYPDQIEKIMDYLESHLEDNSSDKDKKRCIDALLRRGHSYGNIRRCMERLSFDSEDFPED